MKTLFTTLAFLISVVTFGQETTISGTVTDSISGTLLTYATVTIQEGEDEKVVAFAYTNEEGAFSLELPNGFTNGLLKVQFMGYKSFTKAIGNTSPETVYNIQLFPDTNTLEAVTVSKTKKAVMVKGDKVVYNIAETGLGNGNNGLETLQRLPGVKLDKDDNVQFRGDAGVQIMINGRKSLLEGEALREYIRSLNGDDIQSVEIIAQPSARYEATGTTGIINIVLKKNTKMGINGNVYTSGSYGEYFRQQHGGLLFYNDSLWSVSANGYYYDGKSFNDREVTQQIQLDNEVRTLEQNNLWLPHTISKKLGFGVERKLTKNQLVSTEWQYYNSKGDEDTFGTTNEYTNGALTNVVNLTQKAVSTKEQVTGNVFYNFTSDSATTKFDAQVNYAYYNKDLGGFQQNEYANNSIMRLTGTNVTKYNIGNVQLDFNQDITKKLHLEAGFKYARVAMNYNNSYQTNNPALLYIPDSLLINNFDYKENLVSAYTQFSYDTGNWNFLAGLRMESYNYTTKSLNNGAVNSNSYTNWFPSFSANYKKDRNQYKIAYSRRIGRPSYLDLNPFYEYMDAYSLETGNPNLQPRLYHSFEVDYIYRNALNISLYGYLYDNAFADVIDYQEDENYNIVYTANASKGSRFGLSASVPYEVTDSYAVQLELDAAYNSETSNIPEYSYDGSGFGYDISLYQRLQLKNDWTVTWNGYYSGRATNPTGYMRSVFDFSFSVKKSLFDDKVRLLTGCTNFLKNSYYSKVSTVNNVTTDWTNRWETRKFYLQVNYYFGNAKEKKVRGTSLSEEKGRM